MVKIFKSKKFKNNKEIVNFYNKYGFVSIRNYIPKKDLLTIQKNMNSVFKKYFKKNFLNGVVHLDRSNKKKLFIFHRIVENLKSIKSLNLRLSNFQKILFPKKNIFLIADGLLLGLPKDKRLTYDFHQESNFMKNFNDILNIHYPIFFKSDYKNGSMSVLSGSHKEGNLKYDKKRLSHNSYTNLIPKKIEKLKKKYTELLLELNLGDVVFFHKDIIHKSNYNYTNFPRPIGIGRFTSSFGNFQILNPEDL